MVLGSNAWGFLPITAPNLVDNLMLQQPGKVQLTPADSVARISDPGAAVRRERFEARYTSQTADGSYGANLTPAADPRISGVHHRTSLDQAGRICRGTIVDSATVVNCYTVDIELLTTRRVAVALSTTSQTPLNPTEFKGYVPGTSVLLLVPPDPGTDVIILGAIPPKAVVGNESIHDNVAQTTRWRVDAAEKRYIQLAESGSMSNYSTWQPFDAVHGAEWGAITPTGLKVSLDDFMVQMAVNEFCGVFGFYHDQLLRLSGYNLQLWTAGHEREAIMDEAEYNDTQGYTPYPWEAVGMLEPGQDIIQEYDDAAVMTATGRPYYSHWESKYDNLQPFHRTQQFYGYYGQGGRTIVCAPPKGEQWWAYELDSAGSGSDPYESTIQNERAGKRTASKGSAKQNAPTPETPPIGLHEDNTAMDGRRFIASAKGITLAKRLLIPVPSRRRRPEDKKGDETETNYKAAGKYGAGPEHKITGDLEATGKYPNLQRAAGILDLHGYLFNYVGLHPFHWHTKDYKTWEQSELEHAQYNHQIPDYTQLKSKMYMLEPGQQNIDIDHRYKNQKFYQSESFISLLEDGAVVIGDGYGAEIRMCAGTITISAPGDVWFKPGKSAQIWAGRDCIVRANGAVDISTTTKDVRIKAEKNVLVLAGNDDSASGGVLIESRSKALEYDFEKAGEEINFGGVVMRAPQSNVVGIGHNIYMRSGGGQNKVKPGNITLDAGKGNQTIVTKSNRIWNYVGKNGEIGNFFGLADAGEPQVAHYFKKDIVLLSGELFTSKHVFAGKGILADGFIFGNGPLVADTNVAFPCTGRCESEIKNAVATLNDYVRNLLPSFARDFHETYLDQLWYGDKRAGNDRVMDIMEFSFRTDEQYRITDFELFEDRWQQYARLSGQDTGKWIEKPVKLSIGQEVYPFPGRAKLQDEPVFMTQDFNIVDVVGKSFRDKDRNSGSGDLADEYKNPKFKNTNEPQTIQDAYMIVSAD